MDHPEESPSEFLNLIKNQSKHKSTVKYSRYNTNIFFTDLIDKLAFRELAIRNKIEFYTYTERAERQYAGD